MSLITQSIQLLNHSSYHDRVYTKLHFRTILTKTTFSSIFIDVMDTISSSRSRVLKSLCLSTSGFVTQLIYPPIRMINNLICRAVQSWLFVAGVKLSRFRLFLRCVLWHRLQKDCPNKSNSHEMFATYANIIHQHRE